MNNLTEQKNIKYFSYLRKSSEDKEKQALSIPSQTIEVEQKFDNLDNEILSETKSAFIPDNRPVFADMLERIKRGERTGLIAWSPDRLSRNEKDAALITYMVRTGIIKDLKFVSYTFENTPEGIMMLQFALSQSQYESAKKGVAVKRGLKTKAEMGAYPCHAPMGYKNTPDRQKGFKVIEVDEETFPTVRRMWDLMLTGNYTAPQIWKMALSWGMKSKVGTPIARSTVYATFTNPFFYGWYEYPSGSGVWIQGNHTPMVTEAEFNRVQGLLGRKGRPRPRAKHNFAFTGLMKCQNCGSSITAEPKTKYQKNGNIHHYVYYHCTKRKDENCTEKSIELKNLNKQVQKILNQLKISERFKDWAIKNLHEVRTNEAESHKTILKNKHQELESTIKQISSLMLKYTSPENANGQLISDDELQAMKGPLLKKKASLEAELKTQNKEIGDWVVLTEKTFNFARYAHIWFEKGSEDVRKSILGCLGSNLFVKDQEINIKLHPYFQTILENRAELDAVESSARTSKKDLIIAKTGVKTPVSECWLPGSDSNRRPID
jgi:DNA invertase Pin-like site-specific DNA recombinase